MKVFFAGQGHQELLTSMNVSNRLQSYFFIMSLDSSQVTTYVTTGIIPKKPRRKPSNEKQPARPA